MVNIKESINSIKESVNVGFDYVLFNIYASLGGISYFHTKNQSQE